MYRLSFIGCRQPPSLDRFLVITTMFVFRDVHFAPIALNYEKVLEIDTFPLDMLGELKQPNSLPKVGAAMS